MTYFSELPPLERIKRYRAWANDARHEASEEAGYAREVYLRMAERWDTLADAITTAVAGSKQATGK